MLHRALAWTLQSACQARVACSLLQKAEAGGCADGQGLLGHSKECQAAAALIFGVAVYLPKKLLPDIWWSGEAQMGEIRLDVLRSAWR